MRSTQYIGLNKRGEEYIAEYSKEVIAGKNIAVGIDGEEMPLNGYRLTDGRIVYEVVQTEMWSSGSMIFTCLETIQGDMIEESKWLDSEIEEY